MFIVTVFPRPATTSGGYSCPRHTEFTDKVGEFFGGFWFLLEDCGHLLQRQFPVLCFAHGPNILCLRYPAKVAGFVVSFVAVFVMANVLFAGRRSVKGVGD